MLDVIYNGVYAATLAITRKVEYLDTLRPHVKNALLELKKAQIRRWFERMVMFWVGQYSGSRYRIPVALVFWIIRRPNNERALIPYTGTGPLAKRTNPYAAEQTRQFNSIALHANPDHRVSPGNSPYAQESRALVPYVRQDIRGRAGTEMADQPLQATLAIPGNEASPEAADCQDIQDAPAQDSTRGHQADSARSRLPAAYAVPARRRGQGNDVTPETSRHGSTSRPRGFWSRGSDAQGPERSWRHRSQ
ncbi:hypothetical protein FRC07_002854 [Ceratobasidium sp. 392]|nr:hypothetical protein FRC07_002854 [Ceratobasidium sp. 392]